MRKLFRMRHEPCAGTCYAPDEVLKISSLADADREFILASFETLHRQTCGDGRFGFGIDLDEKTGLFVGHVVAPGRTDLCSGEDLVSCAKNLIWLAGIVMQAAPAPLPNLQHCDHGRKEEFREFWLTIDAERSSSGE